MVRKRATRSTDELQETRSVKRKKVEEQSETTVKAAPNSKRVQNQKRTTGSTKRKPKSELIEQNGYLWEKSEDSQIEVGVLKKQKVVHNNTKLKDKYISNNDEGKTDGAHNQKVAKPARKNKKKKILNGNKKACSLYIDDTCIGKDAITPCDNYTTVPKVKQEQPGCHITSTKEHASGKRTRNSRKQKKTKRKLTENITAKTDEQHDASSIVNGLVKTEKPDMDADSSGGESDDDIDWEDVQEAEGQHGLDICDNSSISSSTACSSTTTKTENKNKNVEISIQIPGMRSKRKKKTEDDLMTKIKKAVARFKKQIQLDMHKGHLVTLVAWGFNRNTVCNEPILQAFCMSYVPSHLTNKSIKKWQSSELTNLLTWFREYFPSLHQLKDALSENDLIPTTSCPQNMAEVLVIVLRSLDLLTRLVSSLQPLSMKKSTDGKALLKKSTGSKKIQHSSNNVTQESIEITPRRKPRKVLKSASNLDDSNTADSKLSDVKMNDTKSSTSSTSTFKQLSSPSPLCQSKILTNVKKTSMEKMTPRTKTSPKPQSKEESKKQQKETGRNEAESSPKKKKLRKRKKVNYTTDGSGGSGNEDEESRYSEEKSINGSDEKFVEEKRFKAPHKEPLSSKKKQRNTSPTSKAKKSLSVMEMIDDDDEFEITSKPVIRRHSSQSSQEGKSPVQILSDDSDESVSARKNKTGTDAWVEVYLPSCKSWMCIDLVSYSINQPDLCEKHASKPLTYVITYDNENSVKDVTGRYASNWLSKAKKLRIDADWWEETLLPYKTRKKKMDKKEDSQLLEKHQEQPLPQSVTEYKNHQLYALKRHLLKFEGIYPESATTLGFIRGEAVYSRDCVHLLHTREKWMSLDARAVKQGEEPYKIVKGRMKKNQPAVDPSTVTTDLFGHWQTEDYKPLPVKDGKVPKNEYGNVELFKPSMLPPGSKHIQIPGIQKIAKKLGIDGAPAVVGFDFHCGFCHPVIDGLVVCEESVPTLMDAWRQEQEEAKRKKEEKREKRVLGYWKLFVKSLLIRERLKRKYETQESRTSSEQSGEQLEDEKISSIAVSWPQNMKLGKTSVDDDGHCHVFPKRLHKKDKINGEWTKSCSCGFTLPLDK